MEAIISIFTECKHKETRYYVLISVNNKPFAIKIADYEYIALLEQKVPVEPNDSSLKQLM